MANLRYRTARNEEDRLGQVFTPVPIAELLAESFFLDSARAFHILDLGAGQGVLAHAVLARYKRSKAAMVEVDEEHVALLRRHPSKRLRVIHADVLDTEWECGANPTIIVSNPPYGTLKASDSLKALIESVGLAIPFNGQWVRGDAAFMARAWGLSNPGTHLGLIVASPMIRNLNYRPTRERFVRELRGLCVTQLNPLTFKNAEVSAYLVTGERSVRRRRNVILRKASADGEVLEEIEVSQEDAIASLDIDHHLLLRRLGLKSGSFSETLGTVGAIINRGSRSHQEFKQLGLSAFHTTDFPVKEGEVVLTGQKHNVYHVAKAGDILIPRVGSRCLDRQVRVQGGAGLFTDCVYRITANRRTQDLVWKTLNSAFGIEWRLAHADGSCAKHLPISILLGMPILSKVTSANDANRNVVPRRVAG